MSDARDSSQSYAHPQGACITLTGFPQAEAYGKPLTNLCITHCLLSWGLPPPKGRRAYAAAFGVPPAGLA